MSASGDSVGRPAAARIWVPEALLEDETFAPVVEINEQALAALQQLALAGEGSRWPLLRELRSLWQELDGAALGRAARCPYVLLDAGFADPCRWLAARGREVCDVQRPEALFAPREALPIARLLLIYAWHLARTRRLAARFVLGMSASGAEALAGCTLAQITRVAEGRPDWLVPRWPQRLDAWRQLLQAALGDESAGLEQAQLRGLQMLAGEAWRAAREAARTAAGEAESLPELR